MISPNRAERCASIAHWRALASAAPGATCPPGDQACGGGAGGGGHASGEGGGCEGGDGDEGGGDEGGGGAGDGGGAGSPAGGPVRPGSPGGVVSVTLGSSHLLARAPAQVRHAKPSHPGTRCEVPEADGGPRRAVFDGPCPARRPMMSPRTARDRRPRWASR